MTSEDQPFINAILVSPDDDTPRLVYADWLDERGQGERAEFVRVQCELARLQALDKPEPRESVLMTEMNQREELRRRERESLSKHGHEWVAFQNMPSWWDWGFEENVPARFHRGFVSSVSCTAAQWLQHGKQIVRCQPTREVRLTDQGLLPFSAMTVWSAYLSKHEDQMPARWMHSAWFEAALVWARQELCPECKGEGRLVHVGVSGKHPGKDFCADCGGKGSVDFRTLLGKPVPAECR